MNRFRKRFGNVSIDRKLYFMIFVCMILPLILVFTLMNGVIRRQFQENQCEKELEILKQSKPSLENMLNDTEMLSRNILGDEDIQNLLIKYNTEGEIDEKARVNLEFYMRELMRTRKYLSSISVYKEDCILFQCGNYYEKEDVLEDFELKERLEQGGGQPVWGAAKIHPYFLTGEGNEWTVSLQRNINHWYRMEKLGAERISIKEEYICSLYESLEMSDNSLMYIYDQNGEIVSSTDKKMLGTVVPNKKREMMKKTEGYQLNKNNHTGVLYYKIPLNYWTVVRETDMQQMNSQILIINMVIWITLILSLVFGLLFSFLQKKSIINPIIAISKDVQRVNGEEFDITLHTQNMDEVGILNRNIILMTDRISELIDSVYKEKIHVREAEILSLQSQINPHFLYNALDTLRWQAIEHEEDEIASQIEALSKLFRHVLNKGKEVTTVQDELDHLWNYLEVQKGRFGDRIQIQIDADENLYSCKVIKLILQPLVENAFVHGLEKKIGGGHIHVIVRENDGSIEYCVEDDGVGVDDEKINAMLDAEEKSSEIFALKNVKDRIQLKYGKQFGLTFHSVIGEGTTVIVRIPKIGRRNESMRALIADDEIHIRNGLKNRIKWQELGVSEVFTAADGEEALRLCEKVRPDIVVTDIRMPGITGLELAGQATSKCGVKKVIIMSGYSEFEYAKTAIKLGVIDYLLKPVNLEEFSQAVSKCVHEIREEKEKEKRKKYKIAEKILAGEMDTTMLPDGIFHKEEIVGEIVCGIIQKDRVYGKPESVLNEEMLGNVTIFYESEEEIVFLMRISDSEMRNEWRGVCKNMLTKLNKNDGVSCSMGVSEIGNFKGIRRLYDQSRQAIEQRMYMGAGTCIFYDVFWNINEEQKTFYWDNRKFKEEVAEFHVEGVNKEIEAGFQKLLENHCTDEKEARELCISMKNTLVETVREKGVDIVGILENNKEIFQTSLWFSTLDSYKKWCEDCCYLLLKGLTDLSRGRYSAAMAKTVDYINQHYNEEITLGMLAEAACKSTNYFSYIFKKEMGMNFNEYLNETRIRRAKEILDTTDSMIYEVAELVGYHDYKYFTKVFKKLVGCAPSDYRGKN